MIVESKKLGKESTIQVIELNANLSKLQIAEIIVREKRKIVSYFDTENATGMCFFAGMNIEGKLIRYYYHVLEEKI